MIDSAFLRSALFGLKIKIGKFFVFSLIEHIYISLFSSILDLPDAKGRFEILKLFTNHLHNNACLVSHVIEQELFAIAMSTINYSGADLMELFKDASLVAMKRIAMVILKLKKVHDSVCLTFCYSYIGIQNRYT